jgi:WD40 repeat protein
MKHINLMGILTILLTGIIHQIHGMNHVPTLRSLAICAIAQHLRTVTKTADATTINKITNQFLLRLPQDSVHEITTQCGNYRCTHTMQLHKPSISSLLLTHLHTLVNGSGKKITIHDIHSQNPTQPIATFDAHARSVTALALSRNNKSLISGSHDTTVKIWDVSNPKEPICLNTLRQHGESIRKLVLGHDDKILVSLSDHILIVWNITNPHQVRVLLIAAVDARTIRMMNTTPDDMCIRYGEKNILKTLDLHDINTITVREFPRTDTQLITALACTKTLIATGSTNKKISVSKIDDTGNITPLTTLAGHKGHIQALEFADDETLLASGASDKKIKLWGIAQSGQAHYLRTLYGHKGTVKKLKFMHNHAMLLSISDDEAIRIWNTTDPTHATCINTLNKHTRFVTDMTYYDKTVDEQILLSQGADQAVYLWEPTTIAYAICAQVLGSTDKKQIRQAKRQLKALPALLDQLNEAEQHIIYPMLGLNTKMGNPTDN